MGSVRVLLYFEQIVWISLISFSVKNILHKMAMKNLANCAKMLERAQQTRQFGATSGKTLNESGVKLSTNQLHITAQKSYPVAAALPLPANIDPAETTRFSPQRNRDISAHAILTHQSHATIEKPLDITVDNSPTVTDPHVESYDCRGAVNLNSSMQSNVPSPFGGMHKFTHLNMPGGQWSQDSKFMSHNLQSSHYTNLRREARAGWSDYDENATFIKPGMQAVQSLGVLMPNSIILSRNQFHRLHELTRKFSTSGFVCKKIDSHESSSSGQNKVSSDPANPGTQPGQVESKQDTIKMTGKEKIKRAIKEYGATVIVFHVGISLLSLGACYVLVSRGVDVASFLKTIPWLGEGSTVNVADASTFVVAYAIHKVFAPVRISVTLASAPLIVRYLRSKGILKVKTV